MGNERRVDEDLFPDSRAYFWVAYFEESLRQIQEAVSNEERPDDEVRASVSRICSGSLGDLERSAYLADRRSERRKLGLPMEV